MRKIPNQSDIKKEFEKLQEEIDKNFLIEVEKLNDQLIVMTPVGDTGFLKQSWGNPVRIGHGIYRLVNTAVYAYPVLIEGHSNQLPMGIYPHIRQWKTKLGGK